MKDISNKHNTARTATAQATLRAARSTIQAIKDNKIPKGDPLPVAKVAAITAAKNTSNIIPYCHPLPVDFVGVEFELQESAIVVQVEVKAIYKTGVEMEALTAASVAVLTLYDMLKMLDAEMEIAGIKLLEKRGGKSDYKDHFQQQLTAAVLVMSDTVAAGKKSDQSGKIIKERLEKEGLNVVDYRIIPDEKSKIAESVRYFADELKVHLLITTGGTGLSPRDCTVDVVSELIERDAPGIAEATRNYGQQRTPYAMLSRSVSGTRGDTLIITLPGSRGGVLESLDALFPAVLHAFNMMRAGGHPRNECTTAID